MKKACVLISYWYLSVPIYDSLKELYPEYEWKLIDPNEFMGLDTNKVFRKKLSKNYSGYEILNIGFLSIILNSKLLNPLLKSIIFYFFYEYYHNKLIKFISKENYDFIILTSDWFHSAKTIASLNSLIKKSILIQPCYLDLWKRKFKKIKNKSPSNFFSEMKLMLKKYFFSYHPILKIQETRFGFINKKSRLLIWDDNLTKYYEEIGRKYELISNPIYKSIYQKKKENSSTKSIKNKPLVILFPANYSLNFGNIYQSKLQQEYKRLYLNLKDFCDVRLKIHPNENISYWTNIFNNIDRKKIIKFDNPQDTILKADFIVSTNSYSCVEALLLGTPCINLNPNTELITSTNVGIYTKYSLLNSSDSFVAKDYIKSALKGNTYNDYLRKLELKAKDLLGNYPDINI